MIPVNEPIIGAAEKQYVMDCLDSGWISSEGEYVTKFEQEFASYIGMTDGTAVCNGTAAVEVALYAVGVGEGDEVILPTFAIASCFIAILRLGAIPVLIDSEPVTWNIDVSKIESRISAKTKAILAVHTDGHSADMEAIDCLAKKYNLQVVEDAAEVIGGKFKNSMCGSLGRVSAFSFYANKHITTGEGGMVLSSDSVSTERARSYRNLCFSKKERFLHEDIGYNFRMSGLQAAVGLGQLTRINSIISRKIEMGEYYGQLLGKVHGIKMQVEEPWATSVYWMYCIQLDKEIGLTANELALKLRAKGIGTRPFFRGLHDQPVFAMHNQKNSETEFPVADAAYAYGLYLPSGLTLTNDNIREVCDTVSSIISDHI